MVADRDSICADPEGFLPGPGHRLDSRRVGGDRVGVLRGHGRSAAGARRRHPQGSRRAQPVVVHRHRRQQRHAEQRPLSDQSEAARRAQLERRRRHPAPAGGNGERRGHHAVHAAGAGSDSRQHREPHPVSIHPGERGLRGACPPGRPSWWRRCASNPSSRTSSATRRTTGWRPTSPSTATARRVSASASEPSTTRCTTPSASASSRRYSRSRINTASSWRRIPATYRSVDSLASIYVPSAAGGQVPLSAIAKVDVRNPAAAHQPSGAIPGHHRLVQPGAGHLARRRRVGHRKRRARRSACRTASARPFRARRSRSAAT